MLAPGSCQSRAIARSGGCQASRGKKCMGGQATEWQWPPQWQCGLSHPTLTQPLTLSRVFSGRRSTAAVGVRAANNNFFSAAITHGLQLCCCHSSRQSTAAVAPLSYASPRAHADWAHWPPTERWTPRRRAEGVRRETRRTTTSRTATERRRRLMRTWRWRWTPWTRRHTAALRYWTSAQPPASRCSPAAPPPSYPAATSAAAPSPLSSQATLPCPL